ncbi:MAG: hypothetical protein LIO79_07095 [Rikenellaceae bacterium]|nr:hypothetical protein [Rikenellaceae bacterium]
MKCKFYYILSALLLVLNTGCTKDPETSVVSGNETELRLVLKTPGYNTNSKAPDEEILNEVDVLIFENLGSGLEFRYNVIGYAIDATSDGYEFLARIVPTDNPVRLYLVVNASSAVNGFDVGATEEEVKEAITMSFTSAGFTEDLPMSGIVDLPNGLAANTVLTSSLLRSAARVDIVNNADNFTLTSVRVFRSSDRLQVIPDTVLEGAVTTPSIPDGTTRSVTTDTMLVTDTTFSQRLYIPESAMPATADRQLTATVVVIGGHYGGDANETYYRMDFVPDDAPELFGQVLRNHRYVFNIGSILAPGWSTDEEASVYPSTQIETEVIAWDENTVYMEWDGPSYLGVSGREITLRYNAGAEEEITVQTNLEEWTFNFLDSSGNPVEPGFGYGENMDDPSGQYNVSISDNGDLITVTALTNYDENTTHTVTGRLSAGPLRIDITIDQRGLTFSNKSIRVWGSNNNLGRLGDYVFGTGAAADRPEAMVAKIRNTANFGPGGIVSFSGFMIGGTGITNDISYEFASMFDVIYLTYSNNPTAQSSANLLR